MIKTLSENVIVPIAGLVIAYLFGMVYMYIICNFVLDQAMGVQTAIMTCFVLLMPKDIVLAAITSLIAKRLIPIFRKKLEGGEGA